MKKKYLHIFLLLICYGIFPAVIPANKPSVMKVPQIFLYDTQIFDEVCSKKLNYNISSKWHEELINRMPVWQQLWDTEGVMLLKTAMRIVGKSYPQSTYQAGISLCTFPSMSAPLMVNGRYALNSFTKKPISDATFISTIFHEILHNYIDAFLPKTTPLLEKYKLETKGVLNHLHLLAIEKGVYLKLGWQAKLDAIIVKDNSLPNDDYKRAWKIVNTKNNYLIFIAELQSASTI